MADKFAMVWPGCKQASELSAPWKWNCAYSDSNRQIGQFSVIHKLKWNMIFSSFPFLADEPPGCPCAGQEWLAARYCTAATLKLFPQMPSARIFTWDKHPLMDIVIPSVTPLDNLTSHLSHKATWLTQDLILFELQGYYSIMQDMKDLMPKYDSPVSLWMVIFSKTAF